MSLARFNERWTSPAYPPDRVMEPDLQRVEERFGLRLPDDYRQAILTVGLPRPTIALLNTVVDRGLDLHSIGDFYSPAEMIEHTPGWHEAGMPEHLIAFASDDLGNQFCFDGERLKSGTADSASIWFFDHDFNTVEVIASSFTDWISEFCDI
jgi:cell wall assembly regulator SMI1